MLFRQIDGQHYIAITVHLCTAAQIADIQNHWDRLFNFDGHIGFIDKCSCGITDENGVGEVVFDFLSF